MRSPSSAPIRATLVLYESGPRLGETLAALAERLGNREAAVAREISKLHEECVTGTLGELAERYADAPPKGEIVIVVGPPAEAEAATDAELDAALDEALGRLSPSRAAAEVAEQLNAAAQARLCPGARAVEVNRQAAEQRGRGAETHRLLVSCGCTAGASLPGARGCAAARSTSSPGAARTLAFVEVKARATRGRGGVRARPVAAAPRVAAAAERLAPRYMRDGDDVRIDAISSCPAAGRGISSTSGKGDKAVTAPLGLAPMTLRVAVQMDPLETHQHRRRFDLRADAQGAGARPHALPLSRRRADLRRRPRLRRRAPGHRPARSRATTSRFGEFAILDLGSDVDVVLMRQDPPFDLGYITATHLLERIAGETLVVNDPAAVRNAPEKVWVLDFARFMPPTMITRSLGARAQVPRRAWRDRHQAAARLCRQVGVQDRHATAATSPR